MDDDDLVARVAAGDGTVTAKPGVSAFVLPDQVPGQPGATSADFASQLSQSLGPQLVGAARRFAALSPAARHAWLAQHLAALRADRVSLAQLPLPGADGPD